MRKTIFLIMTWLAIEAESVDLTVTNLNNSGVGSLRNAIANANSLDNINFDNLAGNIDISRELTITKSLSINGSNGDITIDGGNACRIFNISDGTSSLLDVAITNLTVTNAKNSVTGDNAWGGAIYNSENLNLSDMTISNNTVSASPQLPSTSTRYGYGGGICHTTGTMTITNCTVNTNTATGTNADTVECRGQGGGICVKSGSAAIVDSIISDNTATGETNTLGDGGAMMIGGIDGLLIDNCLVKNNCSDDRGGGIYINNPGTNAIIINDSTLSNNSSIYGGGICFIGGDGDEINISNCDISNNSNSSLGVAYGGGCYFSTTNEAVASILMMNSTMSGNKAFSTAGQSAYGGGVFLSKNTSTATTGIQLTITNCTIAGANEASSTSSGNGKGGGFYLNRGGASINNSIIADNTISSTSVDGPDIYKTAAAAIPASPSYNVIGDSGGGHGINNGVDGNIVGSSADLSVLADNGGQTRTMAPNVGSPALRLIPRGSEPYYNDSPAEDQRGYWIDRPTDDLDYLNRTCGAYWDAASPTPARGFRGRLTSLMPKSVMTLKLSPVQ